MPRESHPVDPAAWRRRAALAAALTLVAGATIAAEAPVDADAVLAGVQEWLDGTRDLQARFEQELVSGAFGAGTRESGRLSILRPGRMRWDYLEPEPKVALVDGQLTSLLLEQDRELILGRLDREGELLPALLVGERRLSLLFGASLDPPREGEREGVYRLRLRPLQDEEAFEAVILTTSAPGYAIESAEVIDAAAGRMLYRFSRMRRNRGVDEKQFRLVPGPRVTVSGSHDPEPAAP